MLKNLKTIFRNRAFKILALLLAFYLLFSYFAVDPLARRLLPWFAEHKLASRASMEHVRFDPLRLTLTLDKLQLSRMDGAPLAGFERLYLNIETSGLFRFAWRIKDIRLVAPHATLDIAPDGRLNWSELLAKLNEDDTQPSSTMPRVLIDHILIERGNIQYSERNRATPFQASLHPLGLELEGLSTLPEDRGDYQIAAKLPEQGGTLKWKGDIGLNPIASNGTIALDGIKLAKLVQLLPPDSMPVEITAGDLQTGFSYRFAMVRQAPVKQAQIAQTAQPSQITKIKLAGQIDEPKPEATLSNFTMQLDQVQGKLAGDAGGRLSLGQLAIRMPALKFSMLDGTKLQWNDMEVGLKDATLESGRETLFKLPQASINGLAFDLTDNALDIGEISLIDGAIKATRLADGGLDWQALLGAMGKHNDDDANKAAAVKEADPSSSPLLFNIRSLQLKNWQANYQDMSFRQPLSVGVQGINLGMSLSNANGDTSIEQLGVEAGPLTLKSALYPQPAATLAMFKLEGGDISLKDKAIKLQEIVMNGLQAQVLQEAGKPLNWQAMLEPATRIAAKVELAKPTDTVPAPAWKLALERIALDNSTVHIEDRTTGTTVLLDIQDAALEIRNPSLDLSRALPVSAKFKVRQGGQFELAGKLAPAPFSSDLNLKLTALSLKPLAPYINQFALLRLKDGNASANGKLTLKSDKAGSAMQSQFQGGFSVNTLAISEENGGATFLGWKSLGSDSLTLSLNFNNLEPNKPQPNKLHIDELRVVRPIGKIIIFEDKTVNITRIMRTSPQPAAGDKVPVNGVAKNTAPVDKSSQASPTSLTKPAAGSNAKRDFPIAVERIKIDGGELEFADLSLKPQFGTYIHTLSGFINGLSTNPATTAQVELDGKVDEYGSARIRGSIQPFRATEFTNLTLAFHNLEMNKLTPYSGKFAGRRIESGKMSVDLEYNIKKRQLAGTNKFIINKLRLGEHVDSPDAVNLPLDLAIALLEDSDGVIDLDLPVAGSLDDPQFSYGKVVWKAFVNVLGKIVTSPFRALGNLLGMSSDKLEGVVFDAGSAELAPPEQEKLKKLVEALAKRPSLTLTIVPGYHPVADRNAIQQASVRRDVAQAMGLKLEPGEKPGPLDVNNPKVQSAIFKLTQERSPEGRKRKMLDKLKDFVTTSKPADPAAYEPMLQQLQRWTEVSDEELAKLAEARMDAMQQFLVNAGFDSTRITRGKLTPINTQSGEVQVKMVLGTSK